MCGISNKSGFTLLEILVAIALVAILATIVVPNLFQRKPYYERQQFIRSLNMLSSFAWQQAIITHKTHKITFDMPKRMASVQIETDKKNDKGDSVFAPMKGAYLKTSFTWPKHLEIKNFYIEGFDEMGRMVGGKTNEIWYYVVPNGTAQAVIINIIDTQDKINNKPRQIGLVLNPYSAVFKEYDVFQK